MDEPMGTLLKRVPCKRYFCQICGYTRVTEKGFCIMCKRQVYFKKSDFPRNFTIFREQARIKGKD